MLIVDLNSQLEVLSLKISSLDTKARSAISENDKASAIINLRSKKLCESMFVRRSGTLASIEGIYHQIEEAVDQVEVVKAIQASTKTLKRLNAEVGDVETVEDVLEELRKEMTQVDDVGNAISEARQEISPIDEEAIDEELEALEKEDQARTDQRADFEKKEKLHALEKLKVPNHQNEVVSKENWKDQVVHKDVPVKGVQAENKERRLLEMAK